MRPGAPGRLVRVLRTQFDELKLLKRYRLRGQIWCEVRPPRISELLFKICSRASDARFPVCEKERPFCDLVGAGGCAPSGSGDGSSARSLQQWVTHIGGRVFGRAVHSR